MAALIRFEWQKVWQKRSFLALIALLMLLNIFLLWYLNRPAEGEAPLSAYRAVCQDISGMTEEEKLNYIRELKEQADGISLVVAVQNCYALGGEMGAFLAEQLKSNNPGVYEQYETVYREGNYLVYTDSPEQECALMNELYEEITAVSGYEEYLENIQKNSALFSGISIFASEEDFSSRNIQKSADDHSGLSSAGICWYPSKGLVMAVENTATDLLLLLSVFLFTGQLICEEKRKNLFAVTRAAKRGIGVDMWARLFALLLHCAIICLLLYGSNLLYSWRSAGAGSIFSALQSVAPYMESSLPVSIAVFLVLGFLTKTAAAFLLGLLLTGCAVYASRMYLPQLVGIGFLGFNWLLYALIPSWSELSLFRHISFWGIIRVETLYGSYRNLNLFQFPVSRMCCALTVLIFLTLMGMAAVLLLFSQKRAFTMKQASGLMPFPFHPHDSLLIHEGYKILAADHAIVILLASVFLIGWTDLGKTYTPSAGEQYYQSMMLSLEGELTSEKEEIIKSEQSRYDEIFAQIERIDAMIADGSISSSTGDSLKEQWYSQLAFYPWFQKVLVRYEQILEDGGVFVYDTGYLYLFGQMDNSFLIDLLLISLGISAAFSNTMAMEDSRGTWNLLSATKMGRKRIIGCKWMVCGLLSAVLALLPCVFRFLSVSAVYPVGELFAGIQSIPQYQNFLLDLPVWAFLLIVAISQAAVVLAACSVVLLLSKWRKNYFQTLFLALLLLVAPLILAEMGLDIMKWFSLWPAYGWTGMIG